MGLIVSDGPITAATYEINWYTIDGGGGTSTAGPYILTGTIGQPDAGAMANENYEVFGGFWVGGELCFVDFATLRGSLSIGLTTTATLATHGAAERIWITLTALTGGIYICLPMSG